jgi:diguanylate cyclase (GGDEF)-like protein
VAFTDIDDFKALNTRYTESVVDRDLLPKIMRTIEVHVYSHGWAYRFGGDEYLLLLPNMDLKVAGDFLQTLQERLGSLEFQGIHERIAFSIGLCLVTPDSFLTDREVQEKANRAMQHAKQVSKNCIATFKGEFFGDEDLYVMNRSGHKEP